MLPHFNLLAQCRIVVDALPIDSWDQLPDSTKETAGLTARWAIENAFRAAIFARNKEMPMSLILLDYWKASEVSLNSEQECILKIVDSEVTGNEPEAWEGFGRYYDCCRLAVGVVGNVGAMLTTDDLFKRKRD